MIKIVTCLIVVLLLLSGCSNSKLAKEDIRKLYTDYYEFISDSETQKYFDDFMIAEMYENLYLLAQVLNGNCTDNDTMELIYEYVNFKYSSHQNLFLGLKKFTLEKQPEAITEFEYFKKIEVAQKMDKMWSMGKKHGQIGDMDKGYSFYSLSYRALNIEDDKIVPISYEDKVRRDFYVKEK